jgi:hypothetical protein
VTNDAAKPDCVIPIEDDGSSNEGHSSGKLIVIKINENKHSSHGSSNHVKNANTGNHTLIS